MVVYQIGGRASFENKLFCKIKTILSILLHNIEVLASTDLWPSETIVKKLIAEAQEVRSTENRLEGISLLHR